MEFDEQNDRLKHFGYQLALVARYILYTRGVLETCPTCNGKGVVTWVGRGRLASGHKTEHVQHAKRCWQCGGDRLTPVEASWFRGGFQGWWGVQCVPVGEEKPPLPKKYTY